MKDMLIQLCSADGVTGFEGDTFCVYYRLYDAVDITVISGVATFPGTALTRVTGIGSSRAVPILDFAAYFDFDCGS